MSIFTEHDGEKVFIEVEPDGWVHVRFTFHPTFGAKTISAASITSAKKTARLEFLVRARRLMRDTNFRLKWEKFSNN